jgi:carboxypeptidase C (cathepsin A)
MPNQWSFLATAVLGGLGLANGAIEADRVTSLPGFNGVLPTTHYSGLIPVGTLSGTAGHLHYWFIESENDPSNDPVVLWLNGGPGSSSLIGLLTENGQIMTNDDSLTNPIDGVPQVFYNKYGWTTKANMLYLESPKGVGFSFCDNAKSPSDCVNTDESTAQDAYEFLVNFFTSYSEYQTNKFYITGESYAGIYIPMMMDQIAQNPLKANINLIGSAIGNGCWGNSVGTCAFSSPEAQRISSDFYYGHGMYSQTLRQEILTTCGEFETLSPACLKTLSKMNSEIGNFNMYVTPFPHFPCLMFSLPL